MAYGVLNVTTTAYAILRHNGVEVGTVNGLLNGAVYLLFGLFNGHFRRDLTPTTGELRPHHILKDIWEDRDAGTCWLPKLAEVPVGPVKVVKPNAIDVYWQP